MEIKFRLYAILGSFSSFSLNEWFHCSAFESQILSDLKILCDLFPCLNIIKNKIISELCDMMP